MKELKPCWDILGIGTAAVDDLLYVQNFPQPNSKINVEMFIRQGGGQTATAMVAAARQDVKAAFCCSLGWDDLSRFTVSELEKEGVDCSPCVRDKECFPYHSTIIVDLATKTRTILHSTSNLCPPLEAITPELITRAKILFLDDNSRQAGIQAARISRQFNIPVVADIESDPPPEIDELLPLVDHLIINAEFGEVLSGKNDCAEIAADLSSSGRACCVITNGENGCWFSEQGRTAKHIPAYKIEVVDTTGCGDVFHGAYAAALARGGGIQQAVIVANASAAMKAMQPGGRMGIPTLNTVEAFIRDSIFK